MKCIQALFLVLVLHASLAFSAESRAANPSGGTPDAVEAPPASPPGVGPEYLIGPGDMLQIFVWREPELSTGVPVRPDGKISTPLVEDLVAVGKTPSQLAREVEARLREYIRSPQVNIIVTNAQSAFSKITVIGKVAKPGAVPYRDGMTVLEVVSAAGGLAPFAAGNRSKLVRKDDKGNTKETRVKLDDLVNKGSLKENMEVKPGDVLIVPESYF